MRLARHLAAWVGDWPPRSEVSVVGSPSRVEPGWDGRVRPFLGVEAPGLGTVLAVPPDLADEVRARVAIDGWTGPVRAAVAARLGGGTIAAGTFRSAGDVPAADVLSDVGTWVDPDDERLPDWLRPFNGGVLAVFDVNGSWIAGLGVKHHDPTGRELSVGTEEAHRGRGLARRLVAQAARELLATGAAVTYLHAPDNAASARVADAAGFPDRGWRVWGLFPDGEEG